MFDKLIAYRRNPTRELAKEIAEIDRENPLAFACIPEAFAAIVADAVAQSKKR